MSETAMALGEAPGITIAQRTAYYGPNPYATSPVVLDDLQIRPEVESRLPTMSASLRTHFPEWLGQPSRSGGDPAVEMGETLSQWSLGALNEIRGYLHAAGAMPIPGGVRIWLGFHDERLSRAVLQFALKTLLQAEHTEFSRRAIQGELNQIWKACAQQHPDYQAQILMQAARANDIPVRPFLHGSKYWQYGWGNRSRVFLECAPIDNGGRKLGNKVVAKAIFADLGAPTPSHRLVKNSEELEQAAQAVGWPCVVKPHGAGRGAGVTAGIQSPDQLRAAFEEARRVTRDLIMVEAFVPGDDHRLMVAEGRFLRAIRREPPFVVGDGASSVGQLLQALNRTRGANLVKSGYLRPLEVDEPLRNELAKQGASLETVPPQGNRITLRSNANVSTGGVCTDVSDAVHPSTARMAELIVRTMGLVTAGLDFITTDIDKSFFDVGAFIEINSNPGLGMLMAAGNDAVAIGERVLGEKPGRVPLTLVVVAGAALPEAAQWLRTQHWPEDWAWACGRSAGVGSIPLKISQSRPWPAVDAVLKHQATGAVSIFCSNEDVMQGGLPIDHADKVLLCGAELPDPWIEVLRRHATHFDRPPDWRQAVLQSASEKPSEQIAGREARESATVAS